MVIPTSRKQPLGLKPSSPRSATQKSSDWFLRLMDKILHDLVYLNYGIYGTSIYLDHAEFCPSTVVGNGGMGFWDYYRGP